MFSKDWKNPKEYLTEDEYAHLTAEVRFIRAFIYYDMLLFRRYSSDKESADH